MTVPDLLGRDYHDPGSGDWDRPYIERTPNHAVKRPSKRIYVAGPMRGIDEFNFPAFNEAAVVLRGCGHHVISPAEHDLEQGFDPTTNSLDGFDLDAALRWDFEQVMAVDLVVVLPGWERSTGATLEVQIARKVGTDVAAYDPDSPDGYTALVTSETVLDEAKRLVYGAREASYGHPREDFTRTAAIWTAMTGTTITAPQVALMMIGLKLSRLCHDHKRDSIVDVAGYAATYERVVD